VSARCEQAISAIYFLPFCNVWLTSVCWPTYMCEAWQWNKMQNLRTVGKNSGPLLSRLWTKVHDILRWCRRPLLVSNALADYVYHVSLRRCRPLKLPLKLRSRRRKMVLGPRFLGGWDITPDFGHAFSNRTYFRACGRFSLSSVQRARRVEGEKR